MTSLRKPPLTLRREIIKVPGAGWFRLALATAALCGVLAGCRPRDSADIDRRTQAAREAVGRAREATHSAQEIRARAQAEAEAEARIRAGDRRPDERCDDPAFAAAARRNDENLRELTWAPFRRPETGWATYAPLVAREIGTQCPPGSPGFARALARWQARQKAAPTGALDEATFVRMKGLWQGERPFVLISSRGICPGPPDDSRLALARPDESYGGKQILLRRGALEAYRRMVRAARAESPQIARDTRNLQIFSGFRSPEYDAARCARDGNCDGVARATCSPPRTGLALDLSVGAAEGFGPDSSADENRRFIARSASYEWLVANAERFGFVNYPFEPWHWEWTGEQP